MNYHENIIKQIYEFCLLHLSDDETLLDEILSHIIEIIDDEKLDH